LGRGDAEFVGKKIEFLLPTLSSWHVDETLSILKITDVIHSDAGGLGKPESIGDAGQSCPFTLIELLI
jgi:hypothetical protein